MWVLLVMLLMVCSLCFRLGVDVAWIFYLCNIVTGFFSVRFYYYIGGGTFDDW